LAEGRSEAGPVVGTGWIREAERSSLAICWMDWKRGVDARPALELGVGFSGIAGWIPSTASQCAFHFTPAELAIPGGSRKVNLVVWDVVQMLRRTGGCGDGDLREGGLRQWSWRDQNGLGRISEVLSLSYHIDANSIQTPRENRLALTSPKGRVAHLHIQRLHRMFDILR
jgi:hypothetical protein